MSDGLIAIDILLEPDELLRDRAVEANKRLRQNYAAGFPLDEAHTPHVTLVQRYIREAELGTVAAAVSQVVGAHEVRALEVVGYQSRPRANGDIEVAAMIVKATPQLQRLHEDVVNAVRLFTTTGGTAAAFAPNTDGGPIDPNIISYVERFIPEHSGEGYWPHVTVGFGHHDFLQSLKAEPFAEFNFTPPGVAIYQLGSFGTARIKLWPAAR